MTKVELHATGIALILAFLGVRWVAPLVIANAVVGGVYMWLERDALQNVGSATLGHRIRLNVIDNIIVNILFHVVLTDLALRHVVTSRPITWKWVAFAEILGLVVIDVGAVYPTRDTTSIVTYVKCHVAILGLLYMRASRRASKRILPRE